MADVTIRVTADTGQAQRGARTLADEFRGVGRAVSETEQRIRGLNQSGGGGGGAGGAGGGGANAGRGFLGNIGGGVGQAFIGASIVGGVGTGLSNIARLLERPEATSFGKGLREVTLAFAEGLPAIGPFVRGVRELVTALYESTGRVRDIRQFLEVRGRRSAALQGELGLRGADLAAGAAGAQAADLARVDAGGLDAAGVIARRRAEEAAAAQARLAGLAQNAGEANATVVAGQRALQRARDAGFGSGAIRLGETLLEEDRAQLIDRLRAQHAGMTEALNAQRQANEANLMVERQRLDVHRKQTEELRARLSQLKEEEQRSRGGAAQFGLMDPLQQAFLVQSAKRFQQVGVGGLTAEERQALVGFGPAADAVQRRAAEEAAGQGGFQELSRIFGVRDFRDIQKEIGKVEADIKVRLEVDEPRFKRAIADAMEEFNRREGDLRAQVLDIKLTLQRQEGLQNQAQAQQRAAAQ